MGNCFESCKLYRKPQKKITLIIVGLDNSGKTTMAKRLAGEPVDSVLKTLGFSLIVLRYHSYQISLYDLGGSAQIRDIWKKYFIDVHGVIYMVDSSDVTRLDESKVTFANLLSHENISGKPILVLANKQDKENALDELEVVEQLDIERIVNKYRCLTRIEICSALTLEKSKIDIGIKNGFSWLINNIIVNYHLLNERVQRDMANFYLSVQQDREEWKARVETKENVHREIIYNENGNPFQPIDQVINNINGRISTKKINDAIHTGIVVRNVLIDNYVNQESTSKQNIPDFTVGANSARSEVSVLKNAIESAEHPIEKTPRQYSKHKRKFARFNKTAPMPIDILMEDNFNDSKRRREMSKYSMKSNFMFGSKEYETFSKNYLIRRPVTAPPKFLYLSTKSEVDKQSSNTWDLSTPLDISAISSSKMLVLFSGKDSSDAEDVVSFF